MLFVHTSPDPAVEEISEKTQSRRHKKEWSKKVKKVQKLGKALGRTNKQDMESSTVLETWKRTGVRLLLRWGWAQRHGAIDFCFRCSDLAERQGNQKYWTPQAGH